MKQQTSQDISVSAGIGRWLANVAVSAQMNVLPLIDGLVSGGDVHMLRATPDTFGAMLERGRVDAALIGTLDLQRMIRTPLVIPAGCIATSGPTETIRVFSRVAPAAIRRLHVDPQARTAAAVASILWGESFDRRLELVPLREGRTLREHPPEAVLVVGDAVMTCPREQFVWEIDLGAAWAELTDSPLVLNVWAMRSDVDLSTKVVHKRAAWLYRTLLEARQRGQRRIEEIVLRYAEKFGWTPARAMTHLSETVEYEFTACHRQGMEDLFHLARKHRLIDEIKPLTYVEDEA